MTHHFDHGQRYIELLFEDAPPPPGPGNLSGPGVKRVMAPPVPSMAPEGHYLLFAVDQLGRPTKGKFVKLTF